MATNEQKAPAQEIIDANYAAKISARLKGTAPVMVTAPKLPDANPDDPVAVDARYRSKLAGHAKALASGAGQSASGPAAKSEPAPKATAAEAATSAEPESSPAKETKPEGSFSSKQQRR